MSLKIAFKRKKSTSLKVLISIIVFVLFTIQYAFAVPDQKENITDTTGGNGDLSLQDLLNIKVESVSFFTKEASKAPGTILIYPAQKIKDMPVHTLEDLLQMYVPGIQMSAHTKHGPVIGERGILTDQNVKTLVMLDGQHINMRRLLGYMGGLRLPFLGDYKQIEVIQGPGAILHGSGAICGFINLVPKTGDEYPGWDVNIRHGFGDDLNSIELGYGEKLGDRRSIYLYGGGAIAEGFENTNDYNGAVLEKNVRGSFVTGRDKNTRTFAYPKPTFKLASYLRLEDFSLNTMFHRIAYSNNSYDNELDPRGYLDQSTFAMRPKYVLHLFDKDEFELSLPFEAHDYSMVGTNGTSPFNRQKENVLIGKDSVTSMYITDSLTMAMAGGSESHYEGNLIYRSKLIPYVNVAIGSLAGRRLFSKNKNFFSVEQNKQGKESIDATWNEYAGYSEAVSDLEDVLHFPLTLSGGLRYDYIQYGKFGWPDDPAFNPSKFPSPPQPADQGHLSPRIALSVSPIRSSTVKFSYQEGFNYPGAMMFAWVNVFNDEMSSGDTVWVRSRVPGVKDSTMTVMKNHPLLPALKPELLKSWEANYHGDFFKNRLTTDLSVFFNSYKDPLLWRTFPWTSTTGDLIDSISIQALRQKYGWLGAYTNGTTDYKSIGFDLSFNAVPIDKKVTTTEISLGVSYIKPWQLKRKDDAALKCGFYTYDASAIKADANSVLEATSYQNYPTIGFKGHINQYFFDKRICLTLAASTSSEVNTTDTVAAALGGGNWLRDEGSAFHRLFSRRLVDIGIEAKPANFLSIRFYVQNLLANEIPPARYNNTQPDWGFLGTDVRKFYLETTVNF